MIRKLSYFFLFHSAVYGQEYLISTYAGGGIPVLPASSSAISIGFVQGIARDASGNIYIADQPLNVVFRVTPAGTTTIYAGTGRPGFSGDDGPATAAQLNTPFGLAFDLSGNLLISDASNNAIRKVSTAGIITTIAGTGVMGYSGNGGPATAATLNYPSGITVDKNGNVYVADTFNQVIRMVSRAGTISTVAGNGQSGYTGDGGPATQASLQGPYGVAVNTNEDVYIADTSNNVIRKVDPAGTISTFTGNGFSGYSGNGGPASAAQLDYPKCVAVDVDGNLYICDAGNSVIRQVSSSGIITNVAGDGKLGYSGDGGLAINAEFYQPQAVIPSAGGGLLIADTNNSVLRQVTTSGIVSTTAGNGSYNYGGDNGPALNALLGQPAGIALGGDGSVYISDAANQRVRKISPSGVVTTVVGTGTRGYSGDGGPALLARLNDPEAVAFDAEGNLYIVDTGNLVVRKVSTSGIISTFAGTGKIGYSGDNGPATSATFKRPIGIAADSGGNIYISDNVINVVRKVSAAGIITTFAGTGSFGAQGDGGPATSAVLGGPVGLALDAGGDLYIADTDFGVLRVVNTAGIINSLRNIENQVYYPYSVAIDSKGRVYVTTDSDGVDLIASDGTPTLIAGSTRGYSGDGGPALDAKLSNTKGIAVAASGQVYISDSYNDVIRDLSPCNLTFPSSAYADSNAQTLSLPLSIASACAWSVSGLPSWVSSTSSGTGSGLITLSFQANSTAADRSAVISVGGLPMTVGQDFTSQDFEDVMPGSYYFDAANLLRGKNITTGCTMTDYCPAENVTRAQMAIFIVRAVVGGNNFTYSATPYFSDVQPNDFGFAWIQKLYELGVTTGCAPSLYCPNDSITRAQMAVFIIRARYGSSTVFNYPPVPDFTDVPSTGFAFNYIQRMKEDNITSGCSATAYCPDNPVTRGDMAIFIMRGAFNELLPQGEEILTSVSPAVVANGSTVTLTVTGSQTGFAPEYTQVNSVPGLTVNSTTVINSTTLSVNVTVNTTYTPQPLSIWMTQFSEQAVLPNGLLVQ